MNGDELKNIDNLLYYYTLKKNELYKILNTNPRAIVNSIKKYIDHSNICNSCMGHNNILYNIASCLNCENLGSISDFREKCDDKVFVVEHGNLYNENLIIKYYPNSFGIVEYFSELRKIFEQDKKTSNINYLSSSDDFTNSYICYLIIDNYMKNVITEMFGGFYCRNNAFQLQENGSKLSSLNKFFTNSEDLVDIIIQLISILRDLKPLSFSHGNPIYSNMIIKTSDRNDDGFHKNTLKLTNLNNSGVTLNDTRFFRKRIINKKIISVESDNGFFYLNSNAIDIYESIISNGEVIYPCVLDFYCFVISILCNKEFKYMLMNNEFFSNNIFERMFIPEEYLLIQNSIPDNSKIDFLGCLDILQGKYLREDILEFLDF